MENISIIAIDGGKDTTKSVKKVEGIRVRQQFRSRLFDVTARGDKAIGGNTYQVLSQGNEFLVGDSGTDQDYSTDKDNLYNRIFQHVALANNYEPGITHDLILVTGFPASRYVDRDQRKEYIDNLRGKVTLSVDEKNYSFNIQEVIVRPEGSGVTAVKPEWFVNKQVVVIDIGGQNVNITVYNNLIPDGTMITINAGGIHVEQAIINALSTIGIENLTEPLVRQIIKDKTIIGHPKAEVIAKIVSSEIHRYIQTEIMDTLAKNKLNVKDILDSVVIGGTGFAYKDSIAEYVPRAKFMATLEDSQFANADGFLEMGELYVENR